jgi:hypothetical protein
MRRRRWQQQQWLRVKVGRSGNLVEACNGCSHDFCINSSQILTKTSILIKHSKHTLVLYFLSRKMSLERNISNQCSVEQNLATAGFGSIVGHASPIQGGPSGSFYLNEHQGQSRPHYQQPQMLQEIQVGKIYWYLETCRKS